EHHGPLNRPPHLDKQWITMENAKRLCSDASLLTVLEDENGDVLNISRNTRTVPPLLKRALNIRDETCCFPGCCESRYVDFHHIKHWCNYGETKKDNLVKLCRFHHRQLHKDSYFIEKRIVEGKQELTFKTSTGLIMEQNPRLPLCTVERYFEQQWPDINSQTGVTRWMGEGMDYGMAIDSLVARQPESDADLVL
ncbi:MAG: HNH endonuclease, partial [Algicola sp.]|nr:HNH endonuclease [Algicola sp.]